MAKKKDGESILNVAVGKALKERMKRIAKKRFGLFSKGVERALEDFVERYGKNGTTRPEVSE